MNGSDDIRWRLIIWDVPDRLGGLLARLGFKPIKKTPQHWWKNFNPYKPADKTYAEKCKRELLAAGLKGSWKQVENRPRQALSRRPTTPAQHTSFRDRSGFGGKLNATPIQGSWRRRTRHS